MAAIVLRIVHAGQNKIATKYEQQLMRLLINTIVCNIHNEKYTKATLQSIYYYQLLYVHKQYCGIMFDCSNRLSTSLGMQWKNTTQNMKVMFYATVFATKFIPKEKE